MNSTITRFILFARTALISLLIIACCASTSFSAAFNFVQPAVSGQSDEMVADTVDNVPADPEHFERRGHIQVAANILALSKKLEQGDEVNVNFFENKPYRIIVRERITDNSGNVTITGHAQGQNLQTFIMNINADNFLISFQDLDSNRTYWVTGSTNRGQGNVLEVNDRKRPPSFE